MVQCQRPTSVARNSIPLVYLLVKIAFERRLFSSPKEATVKIWQSHKGRVSKVRGARQPFCNGAEQLAEVPAEPATYLEHVPKKIKIIQGDKNEPKSNQQKTSALESSPLCSRTGAATACGVVCCDSSCEEHPVNAVIR